jgi:hypothetical protein
MALWQISFLFLPKPLVADFDEVPSEQFARIQDDLAAAIPSFALPPDYAERIGQFLPKNDRGYVEMELWGDEKSDDLSIWRDEGRLASVELRVDVRKLDDSLLAGVLALAADWGCVLVERRYRKVCRLDSHGFRALICGHPHHRAMQDPGAWLPVLADEVRRNGGRT